MSPVDWNASAIAGITLHHCQLSTPPTGQDVTPSILCPVYTLDNGYSLRYDELIETLSTLLKTPIKVTNTYQDWLVRLLTDLDQEDHIAGTTGQAFPHPNPLRSLRGSLTTKQPKFGSTGCLKHMKLLEQIGYPCPKIDNEYIAKLLKFFAHIKVIDNELLK